MDTGVPFYFPGFSLLVGLLLLPIALRVFLNLTFAAAWRSSISTMLSASPELRATVGQFINKLSGLLFFFRSLLLPLKAILMHLFSIAVGYGVLVLIFQQG